MIKWVGFDRSYNSWEPAENFNFVEETQEETSTEVAENFEVEKIIKKREKNGNVSYLLKWVGFNKSYNSWEPAENLDCEELINDFEVDRAFRIVAANVDDGIMYLMQWKDLPSSPVSSEEARVLWPKLLIKFLENNINWYALQKNVTFIEEPVESHDVVGDPIQIHCK